MSHVIANFTLGFKVDFSNKYALQRTLFPLGNCFTLPPVYIEIKLQAAKVI